jgi:hypothetical protein
VAEPHHDIESGLGTAWDLRYEHRHAHHTCRKRIRPEARKDDAPRRRRPIVPNALDNCESLGGSTSREKASIEIVRYDWVEIDVGTPPLAERVERHLSDQANRQRLEWDLVARGRRPSAADAAHDQAARSGARKRCHYLTLGIGNPSKMSVLSE